MCHGLQAQDSGGGCLYPLEIDLPECRRPMALDLPPDLVGDEDRSKVRQQIEAVDLIEMNQGAGVTDNRSCRVNLRHEGPIRRRRGSVAPSSLADAC